MIALWCDEYIDDAQGDLSQKGFLAFTNQVLADAEEHKTLPNASLRTSSAAVRCTGLSGSKMSPQTTSSSATVRASSASGSAPLSSTAARTLHMSELHAHWREVHRDYPRLYGDVDDVWGRVYVPTFRPP